MKDWLQGIWIPAILGAFAIPAIGLLGLNEVGPTFLGVVALLAALAGWRVRRRGGDLGAAAGGGATVFVVSLVTPVALLLSMQHELVSTWDETVAVDMTVVLALAGILGLVGGLLARPGSASRHRQTSADKPSGIREEVVQPVLKRLARDESTRAAVLSAYSAAIATTGEPLTTLYEEIVARLPLEIRDLDLNHEEVRQLVLTAKISGLIQSGSDTLDLHFELLGNPSEAAYWVSRGKDIGSGGRYYDAIQCFDRAIEIDRTFAEAWVWKHTALANIAVPLEDWNKLREACDCVEEGLRHCPRDKELRAKQKECHEWFRGR